MQLDLLHPAFCHILLRIVLANHAPVHGKRPWTKHCPWPFAAVSRKSRYGNSTGYTVRLLCPNSLFR